MVRRFSSRSVCNGSNASPRSRGAAGAGAGSGSGGGALLKPISAWRAGAASVSGTSRRGASGGSGARRAPGLSRRWFRDGGGAAGRSLMRFFGTGRRTRRVQSVREGGGGGEGARGRGAFLDALLADLLLLLPRR